MQILTISLLFFTFYFCNAFDMQITSSDGVKTINVTDLIPFTEIGNNYYFLEDKKTVNWFEAAHICRQKGAQLASIESEEEHQALIAYFKANGYIAQFWISANDLIKEGEFNWLGTGLPLTFTNWDKGEPNNNAKDEDCVHYWFNNDVYKWNDKPCHHDAGFICEAPIPKTVTIAVW